MGRGLGVHQRRLVEYLATDEQRRKEGVPLRALRPLLPADRSNRRRIIRSLLERGDLEIVRDDEDGESRYKLSFWTSAAWLWRMAGPYTDSDHDVAHASEVSPCQ